jgi:peroxisomal 2,4-dienoyl-CoA reductase
MDAQGRVDVLVNGAAGNFLASADKLTTNGFKTVFEIDTLGTFNMSQAVFLAHMKKHGGVIINISANLHWNGTALQAHSAAAKAGVDALTKVLACEWGPHYVRVNGIVPGAIAGTEGFERLGSMSNMNNRQATEKAAANKVTSSTVAG